MQRPVVINLKDKSIKPDVLICRPGRWGNPFRIGKDGNRAEVIEKYRIMLMGRPDLLARLPDLAGKKLGCWCYPLPCHGDLLAEMVEALPDAD